MFARFRRPIMILAALALSMSLAAPVVAQSAGSFEIQIQPKATLVAHNSMVTVHFTYQCTFPAGGFSGEEGAYSGFGGSVTQVQGKRVVIGNVGAGPAMLTCDGTPQATQDFTIQPGKGHWKAGKATFDFFVQFTAVSGEVFRLDVTDYPITITAG
jgi:hypothetical protein